MRKIVKLFMALMISLSLLSMNTNQVEASSSIDKLIDIAMNEVGSTNWSKYSKYKDAWCADFVSWVARQAGISTSVIPSTPSTIVMSNTIIEDLGGVIVDTPQRGDLVFYKKTPGGVTCHVAIMVDSTMTIQGNYKKKVNYMSVYDYIDTNGNKTNRSKMIFIRPNYNGTITKTSIADFTVTGIEKEVKCTGSAIKPSIGLYDGNNKISSKYYTVSYSKNVNPGTATVTIKGKNLYTGTITRTFTILAADYTKLNETKATVPTDLSIYTEDTVNALNTALTSANNLAESSGQSTVDAAEAALKTAIEGLAVKPADYTTLDAFLETIPQDLSDYTKDSVTALNSAIEAISRDKLITEQADVDQMLTNVQTAFDNLKINYFRSEVVVPVLGVVLVVGLGIYMYKKKKNTVAVDNQEETVNENEAETNNEAVEENTVETTKEVLEDTTNDNVEEVVEETTKENNEEEKAA